jgi:hypothetical protein
VKIVLEVDEHTLIKYSSNVVEDEDENEYKYVFEVDLKRLEIARRRPQTGS